MQLQFGATNYIAVTVILLIIYTISGGCFAEQHLFQEVIDVIEEKRLELSHHELFKFIADESIPASKRMQFAPYWTYFALSAADVIDNWIRIPNPQTELEYRVNVCIEEDDFHYNLFIHDVESVLGYDQNRFGSYEAVLRHLWGDESKAIRMLIYAWVSGVKRSKDPMVALASFEAGEAGLKDFFHVTYDRIFNGKDGYPDLKYFGQTHMDLEANHTLLKWFKDGDTALRPLANYQISEETMTYCLDIVEDMFYWFDKTYDSLYNLCLAENSIRPEKYLVEGYPAMNAFPAEHPNRALYADDLNQKDEL